MISAERDMIRGNRNRIRGDTYMIRQTEIGSDRQSKN